MADNYHQEGPLAAAQMLGNGADLELRGNITALTDSLRQQYRKHLEGYLSQKTQTSTRLRSISWLSVLAAMLLTTFSIYYLMRTARRRRNAVLEKERKQRELKQHLVFIKDLFDNAPIGFHSTDAQGNILEMNQTELDWLGYTLHLERIPFSLAGLLHSVDNMFRYRAAEKGLQFEVQADDALPEAVLGDPTRLTQILVNLLGNAFKFTSEGGVRLHVSEANREGANTTVRFTVQDTGIGIVEYNPMNRRIAELLLEGWGFRYDHAENGRAALELLRKKAYW